ncbi:hypothetical protein EMCRGX_G009182 [Ephydatia muelleri]
MLLRRLRDHWGSGESGHNEVLWAVACICFFGFFRLGKLLNPGGRLKWEDISFDHPSNPTMMKIHLSTSKCDKYGHGADVFIGQTSNALCPITACLAFLRVRGTEPGPFFVTRDGSPYAGHSFRIGAATAAAIAGVEDSTIQTLGRWNSAAFLTYIRTPARQLAAVSETIAKLP